MKKLKPIFYLLTLAILSTANMNGGIEKYFKKVDGKSDRHLNQMENIDFIYLINLDERPEKLKSCVDQLTPYGIYPYRFSAVNGWKLSLEAINDLGVKYQSDFAKGLRGSCYLPENNLQIYDEVMQVVGRNYFSHGMSLGSVGCALSHLSVLQDAYDSGYKTIWVMEDDIEIFQNPHTISALIAKLDAQVGEEKWDILFTDQDTKNQEGKYVKCRSYAKRPNYSPKNPQRFALTKDISPEFRKIGARYGSYSMIVRRSGIEKILDFLKTYKIFLPYDLEFYLPHGVQMYCVTDDVVSTLPQAPSDNSHKNYKTD